MQQNSIHNPAQTENVQTKKPFPASGNNFVTLGVLSDETDLAAWAEAHAFVENCQIALQAFEKEQNNAK